MNKMEENKPTEAKVTYEEAVKRLEVIVRALEDGSAPLDESIRLFEEGTVLVKQCGELLEKAEQRVKVLTSDGERDFQ